ncbi:MAG: hypothetical protein ACQEQL_03780 [Pseudomonadota bacterium]
MEDQQIKENITRELTEMGESPGKEGRKEIIHRLARKYNISDEIVEKHIAEWEAGKGD